MRCRKFWVRIDLIPLYSRYPDRVIFGDNKIFTLNLLELGLLTRSALTQHHAHPVLSWDSGEGRLERGDWRYNNAEKMRDVCCCYQVTMETNLLTTGLFLSLAPGFLFSRWFLKNLMVILIPTLPCS